MLGEPELKEVPGQAIVLACGGLGSAALAYWLACDRCAQRREAFTLAGVATSRNTRRLGELARRRPVRRVGGN